MMVLGVAGDYQTSGFARTEPSEKSTGTGRHVIGHEG